MDRRTYEVVADRSIELAGSWRVESSPDKDGVIDIAIFMGPNAERQAREYATWRERQ